MRIGWAPFVVFVFAACGGSIDPSTQGASSSGGSSSGSSGTSSGGSSGASSGGNCTTVSVDGSRACVPGTARPGVPITVEVDATDGCLSCQTTVEECQVVVDGSKITLSMSARHCPSADVCPPVCLIPEATCTLPPLAAGKYVVAVVGENRTGLPPRELVVAAEGTETSCTLPPPGGTPDALDAGKYSRSCTTSDDCVVAITGNVCPPCRCPDIAIAKSAAAQYESDYRALVSQCPTPGGVVCGACAPVAAECDGGTCKLVPVGP